MPGNIHMSDLRLNGTSRSFGVHWTADHSSSPRPPIGGNPGLDAAKRLNPSLGNRTCGATFPTFHRLEPLFGEGPSGIYYRPWGSVLLTCVAVLEQIPQRPEVAWRQLEGSLPTPCPEPYHYFTHNGLPRSSAQVGKGRRGLDTVRCEIYNYKVL